MTNNLPAIQVGSVPSIPTIEEIAQERAAHAGECTALEKLPRSLVNRILTMSNDMLTGAFVLWLICWAPTVLMTLLVVKSLVGSVGNIVFALSILANASIAIIPIIACRREFRKRLQQAFAHELESNTELRIETYNTWRERAITAYAIKLVGAYLDTSKCTGSFVDRVCQAIRQHIATKIEERDKTMLGTELEFSKQLWARQREQLTRFADSACQSVRSYAAVIDSQLDEIFCGALEEQTTRLELVSADIQEQLGGQQDKPPKQLT